MLWFDACWRWQLPILSVHCGGGDDVNVCWRLVLTDQSKIGSGSGGSSSLSFQGTAADSGNKGNHRLQWNKKETAALSIFR